MREQASGYPLTKEVATGPSFYKRYESEIAGLASGLALMTPLFLALAKQELVDRAVGPETANAQVAASSEYAGPLALADVASLPGPSEFGQTESVVIIAPQAQF
ncbi:MAG TPA: hypothetical protein VLA92_04970 [Candidatus Saccharimonadales bacterium]|nr:hypothetical protein [Candidatus Saccharimonadales bacterium]